MHSPKLKIDPLENALDFTLSALNYLSKSNDISGLKYGILHLSSGIELFLKEALKKEHWSFLFEDINKANLKEYETGDFQSVRYETCLKRLEGICNISLDENDKKILKKYREKRNKLEHFGISESKEALIASTAKVLSILIEFINKHLEPDKFNLEEDELNHQIKLKLKDFQEFEVERLNQIESILKKLNEDNTIIECPICYQESLILQLNPKCLFCYYSDESETMAYEWIESILGIYEYTELKDGGVFPLHYCPECVTRTLVYIGPSGGQFEHEQYICFNCGRKWMEEDFTTCLKCGELMLRNDSDMCEECRRSSFERDN